MERGERGEPDVGATDGAVSALRSQVRGPVLTPSDAGYDDERAGFPTVGHHHPDVVVGATGTGDVVAAVDFARERALGVAVQATGHGLAITAPDGVLVTTRRMAGLRIDPVRRTAWVEAGVTSQRLVEAAAVHGLAPLTGSGSGVGVVGYTLGGGLGLLARRHGYAADHVGRVDLVTADGRLRRLVHGGGGDGDADADLFWAVRGAGGNFGVVTGLELDLVPVTRIVGGVLSFPAVRATEVIDAYRGWTATLPEATTSSVGLVGDDVHVRFAHVGDEDGAAIVAPLRDMCGVPALRDDVRAMPFTDGHEVFGEPTRPVGTQGSNALLRELDLVAVETVLQMVGPESPLPCVVDIRHLGGALSRRPPVDNAVGHREAQYLLHVQAEAGAVPEAGADHELARTTLQKVFDALDPWTVGRSLNFMNGDSATHGHIRAAYEPADLARLTALKSTHDPTNIFRPNHNLPPP